MVGSDVGKSDGHCKDIGHVSVSVIESSAGVGKGAVGATFLPTTACVNVPGYDGWAVQLVLQANTDHPKRSLRLLPPLAEVFPAWLRRAAKQCVVQADRVVIEHTFDGAWIELVVLTPAGARSCAKAVMRALELAPPGEHG